MSLPGAPLTEDRAKAGCYLLLCRRAAAGHGFFDRSRCKREYRERWVFAQCA